MYSANAWREEIAVAINVSRFCLLICSLVVTATLATAGPILVKVSGNYDASVIGTAWPYAAQAFSLSFTVDQSPSDATAQTGGGAFSVPVDITYTDGGASQTDAGTAGWFEYPDGYTGLDLRFTASDGSFLQTIINLPAPVYTGTDSQPTIVLMDNTNEFVSVFYYSCASCVSDTASVPNGVYKADSTLALAPEPSTALLFSTGVVAALAGFRRKCPRTPRSASQ
jgi:hypothetical protein